MESTTHPDSAAQDMDIAVVGMAGRFPKAASVEAFWRNLCNGVEAISFFDQSELEKSGYDRAAFAESGVVKAASLVEDIDLFDASFFGYSPREAELMDPQQRILLECAWETLEDAGCDPYTYPGLIGVFAGSGVNTYVMAFLNQENRERADALQLTIGNDKDYVTTRLSYKLNLRGPSVCVQTACSTSLVAVHLACRSLIDYECDLALSGGVSIRAPQPLVYRYQEGGIVSPDGHCRTFDEKANGTVFGNGAGLVALKRLPDALKQGDHIYAVIKGSAINNDGSQKVGYTAPGVEGQAAVIQAALATAAVDPSTIGYLEAHGTATPLGDLIELSALKQVFAASAARRAIGSVKTNIGHLDTAAGIAGLIKTALALKHGVIPPTLHFERPNPRLELEHSPFEVVTRLQPWPRNGVPRRAGVSSFGIGGTNAHLVLEEGPQLAAAPAARPWQLLTVSAKTSEALAARCRDLAGWLRGRSDTELADAAYTTQVGRAQFSYRYAAACGSAEEAGAILENAAKPENSSPAEPPAVVFLFPGQGTQHPRMGFDLYRHEPVFRTMVDHCAGLLRPAPGEDLRSVLFPAADADLEQAARKLTETAFAQPALFVLEYALASLWMSWGIEPRAMLGHSVGELVAACVAGVFSLPDALTLVAERGRLMQQMPHGAMLAAAVSEPEAWALCGGALSVAAVNAERLCVISGPEPDVDALRKILEERKTPCHVLHTSHAFHSRMMEPAAAMFRQVVEKVRCHAPRIPIASNVTGQWMTPEQAVDPGYWAEHILRPVRFGDGLARALTLGNPYFIEAGPGQALSKIARRNAGPGRPVKVVASLPDPGVDKSAGLTLTSALGQAWSEGVAVDWQAYHRDEKRRRVSLPTYPFQRERFWAFPDKGQGAALKRAGGQKRLELDNWFHVPGWKSAAQVDLLGVRQIPTGGAWLIVSSEDGPGHQAAERLRQSGEKVVEVRAQARFAGAGFECVAPGQRYSLDTTSAAGWRQLLSALKALDAWPHTIAHVLLAGELATGQEDRAFEEAQECGFESLLAMTQALEESTAATPSQLFVFTTGLAQVTGGERIRAEHATVLGLCRTIPQECPNIECRVVDLDSNGPVSELAASVVEEMRLSDPAALVAWRAGRRWRETYEPVTLKEPDRSPFRERGVYLITGGLGGLGLGLAKQLARECRARLVLAGRRELPPRADWDAYLRSQAENDSVAARLRALLEIEESGGEVLAIAADITDRGQLENAIAAAAGRFGAIDGVFHLAGVPGAGLLQMKSHREAAAVMAPKALGALALKQAFASRPLDFVVFFSSITAIVGGVGQSDYAAANTLLDALANSGGAFGKTPVIAIDWDAWQSDTWQDASLRAMPDLHRMLKENRKQFGIRFEEGFTVLRRAVAARVPQLIVSTKDLAETMSAHRKWARSLMEKANQSPGRAAGREKPRVRDASAAPPRNATEAAVAELWKEMLGLESIGIHDNFIELGGHSLLAIQLLARMREDLQVELPMRAIFERPTVAGIAELIAGQRDQSAPDENDIARILEEIEQLSEQEVNDKLQEAGGWPAVQTGPDSLAGNGQGRISCRT